MASMVLITLQKWIGTINKTQMGQIGLRWVAEGTVASLGPSYLLPNLQAALAAGRTTWMPGSRTGPIGHSGQKEIDILGGCMPLGGCTV